MNRYEGSLSLMKKDLIIFLNKLMHQVNDEYFHFSELPTIFISQGKSKKNPKSIIFGSYHLKRNEIRIHPILLGEKIPIFVVSFVIYHEMLHYEDRELLLKRKKGTKIHTIEFRDREKRFVYYEKSQKILKELLYGNDFEKEELEYQKSENNRKSDRSLEQLLVESVKKLENVLGKYADDAIGVIYGEKKIHVENELDLGD